MAPFTKEQMLDELRTIFLFEADHLLMGAGDEVAEAFIGFPTGEAGEYCHQDPSRVDLGRFRRIPGSFERGYDYAFRPSLLNTLGEHEVQDLTVFMDGTPRSGGISSGGETHRFMSQDGLCRAVADAVHARWRLEWDQVGRGSHTFTTRELALLANMSEGAVRNAIADKSDAGLKVIPGAKPVSVEHDEAWRWLSARRGFIPTPERPRDDRFLTAHLRDIETPAALGRLIAGQVWSAFGSPDKAPSDLGWEPAEVEAWSSGTFAFDAERAQHLAERLAFDVPLFVGKALEVSLRRDDGTEQGARP